MDSKQSLSGDGCNSNPRSALWADSIYQLPAILTSKNRIIFSDLANIRA